MWQENPNLQLNLISTQWSLVWLAHHGPAEVEKSAREELLRLYGAAVYRYLCKVLHNADAANDIFQEFALHLVHGDLRGANPQRGRFRHFLKGTLFHLIAHYRSQQRKWPEPLPDDGAALAATATDLVCDHWFLEGWRDELLARAWSALAESETRTGQPYYTVLRSKAEHPEMRSAQLAEQLAAALDRPFTAAGVRQILHRGREKFAALLLEEVKRSLGEATAEQLDEELAELGLLDYCRPALGRGGLIP